MEKRFWLPVVAASAFYFGAVAEADNDLWMHLFVGRWIANTGAIPRVDTLSYTAQGAPWVDHEWLWQLMAFETFDWGGSRLLFVGKLIAVGLCVAACGWSMAQLHRSVRNHRALELWAWGITLLLVIPVLARGWAMRPQLVSYVLLPALFGILTQWERGVVSRWLLLALTAGGFALWSNLHGAFVLGLATVACFAGGGLLVGWAECLRRTALLVACGLASCLNPYGGKLYLYLADELGRSHPITEWQPVGFQAEHTPFFLLLVAFVATVRWVPRSAPWAWRLVLVGVVFAFAWRHQRHTPVFALCAAPLLSVQLDQALVALRERGWALSLRAEQSLLAGIAFLALLQAGLAVAGMYRCGGRFVFDPRDYPVRAVQALKGGDARGNLAVPLDWGGYILWHLAPAVKPSLDGRFATVYPEEVVADNFSFFRGEASWRRLLRAYPTEAVLLPAGVVHPLQREAGWKPMYGDEVAVLYVREDRVAAFPLRPAPGNLLAPAYFP